MQCCMCGAAADDQTPGDFDGLRIGSRHCGVYEVSGTVLVRLLRLSLPERAEVLAKAKRVAGPNQSPYINGRTLERPPAPGTTGE